MVPRAGLVLAGLISAACNGDVDYVTTAELAESDGGYAALRDVEVREPCAAGTYRGSFRATRGLLPLEGQIVVTMTRSSAGEFTTVPRNSALVTPPLSTGATVTAQIVGDGSCTTGAFVARMEDAWYHPQPDADPPQPSIPFTGQVTGTYRFTPRGPALMGEWDAFLEQSPPDQPISGGTWMAVLGLPAEGE